MWDTLGDEIAGMDPLHRLIRADGLGQFYLAKTDDASRGEIVLVAEEDGRVLGFGVGALRDRRDKDAYTIAPFHDGEVGALYVVPEARDRGIGTALIQAFETWFRENGCGAVHITVDAFNERARRFYGQLGYQPRDIHQIKPLTHPVDGPKTSR